MTIRSTLNKSLILPIFSLVLVAVALVAIFTHETGNAQLERRINDLAEGSAVLFEELLWQTDHETIEVLLDRYVSLGAVTAAQITASSPRFDLQVGERTADDDSVYRHSRTLLHREADSIQQLGTLTLEMSREGVWQTVRVHVLQALVVATLAVIATTIIIQHLLYTRLIDPVLRICKGLDKWEGDWHDFRIDLGRGKSSDAGEENELDRLVSSIHGMRDHILEADSIIESKEKRLLSAARIAGIGYASFEFDSGQIIECDENFAGIFDLTVDEMLQLSIRDDILRKRLHAEDVEQGVEIRRQLQQGNATEGVFRISSDAGEYRYIRQLFEVSPVEEGPSFVVRTVAQDVTELSRLQATLVHAQKVKAIGNLTGGVAHDFNNILAVIAGNLELLDELMDDASARQYVATSQHAVELGAELTHQLLAFARKQPLRPEILDLSRMLRDSLSLLRTSVGESVDLEVIADGGLWLTEVDKTQLEAAVLNLVINARDAMPDGGKLTIEVGNARLDRDYAERHEEVQPGQYVCIAITDTGCGMSASMISQALEPFFSTKDVGKGTGLGLPMAFGFVKQSAGHLKIYSEVDRGTTVKLYLPRIHARQEVVRASYAGPSTARFNGLQVFLVEDNEDLRKTITMQLEQMGAIVHSASEGHEVLDMARGIALIDLILCDVILPHGMKGPEVVSGLQKFYPAATVIYMSGYTENAIIHQGRLDEGVIMLQKPFSRQDLIAAFASASESADPEADT
ncbi:ATP-binding protein [Granulosicoccus sp. 3-233]|uniref:ATP-binding protein n=1 Tax=Granulosicoccus sp. 3-233 TaxID=3417969 RepID=UPI003D33E2EF